jgi:hypothetical protein
MPPPVETVRFDFAFDPAFRLPLAALGMLPGRAWAELGPEGLRVRFGPWSLETPVANLAGARPTGPYSFIRVVGPHLSLADRGVTFGSNSRAGACILFREPVAALEPTGRLRHPGATLTVADVAGLVAAVEALAP